MKSIKTTLILLSSMLLFACGSASQDGQDKTEKNKKDQAETSYEGMDLLDLSAHNIPAEIYIPGKEKGRPELQETPYGSLEITIGRRYDLEIIPFGMSKKEKKEELEGDLVYSITILEEDENEMLYKKSIADSGLDPEFHFFYQTTINGEEYSVSSAADREFSQTAAKEMLQSAKSLKAKKAS